MIVKMSSEILYNNISEMVIIIYLYELNARGAVYLHSAVINSLLNDSVARSLCVDRRKMFTL